MLTPLQGVRVCELAQWTFVPAAGAILADWGADVIKVEHPITGDAQRGLMKTGVLSTMSSAANVFIEQPNRGKRSVGIDVASDDGRDVLEDIVKTSDVFLTNMLPGARQKLRIEVDDLRKVNPNLIYVRGSAHGNRGAERVKGGYDMTAFWSRGGIGASVSPKELGGILSQPGPGFGDQIGGLALAAGVAGALVGLERSGEPSVVDVSLISTSMWALGLTIGLATQMGLPWQNAMPSSGAGAPTNPLVGVYGTSDEKHISLVMLQAFRYWPDFCRHIDRPDLIDDERFDTDEKLAANTKEAGQVIAGVMATRTLAEWSERFETLEGQWSAVQNTLDLLDDPVVRDNGYLVDVERDDGTTFQLVGNPVQYDDQPPAVEAAPEHGQHTEELLLEMGYDWDRIIGLKDAGAIT
ncbi:MAG TPA: CoA transferase [Acidimicrobiales bacterium]